MRYHALCTLTSGGTMTLAVDAPNETTAREKLHKYSITDVIQISTDRLSKQNANTIGGRSQKIQGRQAPKRFYNT